MKDLRDLKDLTIHDVQPQDKHHIGARHFPNSRDGERGVSLQLFVNVPRRSTHPGTAHPHLIDRMIFYDE